jgi:hypothetical protein
MNAVQNLVGMLIVAAISASSSVAEAQASNTRQKADKFREVEATLQRESSNSPVLAPADRTAAPADPIPAAMTPAEKRARFAAEERAMQRASTNMAPSSPRVDRKAKSADPIPTATTRAAKRERFIEQEKELQRETP